MYKFLEKKIPRRGGAGFLFYGKELFFAGAEMIVRAIFY